MPPNGTEILRGSPGRGPPQLPLPSLALWFAILEPQDLRPVSRPPLCSLTRLPPGGPAYSSCRRPFSTRSHSCFPQEIDSWAPGCHGDRQMIWQGWGSDWPGGVGPHLGRRAQKRVSIKACAALRWAEGGGAGRQRGWGVGRGGRAPSKAEPGARPLHPPGPDSGETRRGGQDRGPEPARSGPGGRPRDLAGGVP